MNDKTLLAIMGSPHLDGSTAAMLNCVANAAIKDGWQVKTVNLYRQKIAPCNGCRRCNTTGECIIEDDATQIAALLRKADRVVLAAPTYWANVPAVVKNLFDRLVGVVIEASSGVPKPRLSPNQKYILLTSCSAPFLISWISGQSVGSLRAMKEFFKYSGMRCKGCVVFAGAKKTPSLPKNIQRKIEHCWTKQ